MYERQLREININPRFYYIYFDNQCINTLDLIKKMEKENVLPAHLLIPSIALAQQYARKAITIGLLHKKDHKKLEQYWAQIESRKAMAYESYKGLEDYQSFVHEVERYCLS